MTVITYSELRNNLKSCIDQVNDDMQAIVITRRQGENAVLISEDEYNNMKENLYLMSHPENYQRLLESKAQIEKGQLIESDLLD